MWGSEGRRRRAAETPVQLVLSGARPHGPPAPHFWQAIELRIDDYERGDKPGRDYPRKKREKPPGDPHLRAVTANAQVV